MKDMLYGEDAATTLFQTKVSLVINTFRSSFRLCRKPVNTLVLLQPKKLLLPWTVNPSVAFRERQHVLTLTK